MRYRLGEQTDGTGISGSVTQQHTGPVRRFGIEEGSIAAGGAIAFIGFFLPWIKTWLDFGLEMGTDSGFSFAKTTDSVSSGNSLTILFVVLIAAALAVAGALYAGFATLNARSYKTLCAVQMALAVAAIAVIALTVPSEIDTWTGIVVEYQFGIWITILGLVMVGVGGLARLISRSARPLSPSPAHVTGSAQD